MTIEKGLDLFSRQYSNKWLQVQRLDPGVLLKMAHGIVRTAVRAAELGRNDLAKANKSLGHKYLTKTL